MGSDARLVTENLKLRSELDEARETLRAISSGEVDAFFIQTNDGQKIFTLNSAEHAYRVMVEAMNEGAATILYNGTIVYSNNRFAELLCQSPSLVCGQTIWQYIATKDEDFFKGLFSQARTKPSKGELFLVDSRGALIDVHVSLGAVDFNGHLGISMVITDLTERKQNEALVVSENLNRSILDQAAEAIIVCDSNGIITRANPEANKLTELNPIQLPFDKAFPLSSDDGEPFPLFAPKLPDAQPRGLGVSLKSKDGSIVELNLSVSHLENASVGVWYVVTLTDVTPIKRMEKLKAAKEAAESANNLKTSFLSNMSHEIRTPLGAIVGFADLLIENEVDPVMRSQYLEIISRSGKALTVLIDDILDLSKIEAGRMSVEFIEVPLMELIAEVVSLFSHKVSTKGITLMVEYEKTVPQKINSDPARLRQILINIVGNAIKFTSRGGVKIFISVVQNEKNNNQIMVRVQDTGAGLDQEQQQRIFAPFTQGDDSTTRKYGGTGLGLILSRRLAQALGGNVFLESSKLDGGSVFGITVALNEALARISPAARTSPSLTTSVIGLSCLKGLKILIVDDSQDNQLLFTQLFARRGAHLEIASNGREGVDRASAGDFDLILMDMQMPVLDGYGATQELRNKGYTKPIIALTAYAMKEEKDKCVAIGCDAHLSKPINMTAAVETIKSVTANFKFQTVEPI